VNLTPADEEHAPARRRRRTLPPQWNVCTVGIYIYILLSRPPRCREDDLQVLFPLLPSQVGEAQWAVDWDTLKMLIYADGRQAGQLWDALPMCFRAEAEDAAVAKKRSVQGSVVATKVRRAR
jgi:hypothetical protein